MKQTNKSVFTRVLALVLCLVMLAGAMTSCLAGADKGGDTGLVPDTKPDPKPDTKPDNTPETPSNPPAPGGDDENQEEIDPNEIFSASAEISDSALIYGALANEVTIGEAGLGAILPADVKIADGASSVALSIKKAEAGDELVLGEGDVATALDVHISGVDSDNKVPMIVNLGSVLAAGFNATELKLYHTEGGVASLMTRVDSADDFAIHNQYTYNAETGEVSIYVASFSVFSAVQTTVDVWDGVAEAEGFASGTGTEEDPFVIETAAQLIYFRNQVDAGVTFDDQFVILAKDIDLADKIFDPIGFGYYDDDDADGKTNYRVFMGTFDGAGHTIYNLYENCWELDPDKTNYSTYTYSTAGAGLFASIKDATIKNLAISGAEIVFECVDMGVVVGYAQGTCHFENIVVTDSNIANYNRYTGGVVGEVSYGPYGIDTSLGYSHTFKNITVDSTVKVSGLWGSFGCGMGGVIGGKWGDATVKMENVVSAAEMDVYNDVTSAYQWYAFRGCGMLIGHTEEPVADGRHSGNATASFLTCENVTVYYGDWVNYHYYEFENQDSGTGQKYPWVRAEAGEYCDAFSNIRYGVPTINGVKVSDLTEEELKALATDYTPIVFDQLYGADVGMYGTATHPGVTVYNKNTKTIYIQNNMGWENLKLYYWFQNGNDTWATLEEGIALTEENGVYRVDLPAYAFGFRITADGENVTRDFYLSEVAELETYNLDFEHVHYFVSNKCDCGAVKQLLEHQFTLGEDGEAKHSDGGNTATTYEETNDFTLTLEGLSSVYDGARDEMGNSCLKLGTSSLLGKFSFTVPEEVEKVIIYVAGYKANDAKVNVNDVEYEITTLSNNGEYTAVEVDTSETKTVSFTTVDFKGESRCMINTISYVTSRVIEVHECNENEEIPAVDPTCTETGLTAGKACSVCGKVMVAQETVAANGHTEETVPAEDATCTKNGLTEGTRCSVCETTLIEQQTIPSTGHNYVEGTCSKCGEAFPSTSGTYTYVFNDYTKGTQYAEGEVHELDANVTITTTQCHFTSELRIYSSSTNDGYAIIESVNPISVIAVNAGNNKDTINIYGSDDGVNWITEPIATISVTSTSYNNYTADLGGEYKYLKLDVAGSNQVRIKSMTLTTVPDCAHANTTEKVVAPTCTEAGRTDTVCSSCGKVMSTVTGDAATGHVNTTTTTVDATCTEAGSTTVTCNDCGDTVSTTEIPATGEHTYVDGTCTGCGTAEVAPEPEHTCESVCGTCGGCTDASCEETACANKCNGHATTPTWTLVEDISTINSNDIIIIVWKTSNGKSYAISNDKGTSAAPTAVEVTLNGEANDNIKWNISNDGGNLTIYPNGTTATWLYCTATNNGVRVGTNTNKTFTIDAASGYLKNTATSRYVGVYTTNPDVRCYTNTTGNIANQTLAFYVYNAGASGGETTCEHTNTTTTTVDATCTEAGSVTVTCNDCDETISIETVEALGHTTDNGTCERCGSEIGGSSEPTVVLEITKDDFNSTSYDANNNTKTEGDYSYTSYQVMNQSSVMQWQKSKGYITITSNEFVKLELKVTAGTYTVTVGGETVTGTTSNGVTTYDLTGLTGKIKISVGSATGKVDYLKFYK